MKRKPKKVAVLALAPKQYRVKAYGLGFDITHEMWKDDRYGIMSGIQRHLFAAQDAAMTASLTSVFHDAYTDPTPMPPFAATLADLYRDQAKPGETRADCKVRLHAENYAMGKNLKVKKNKAGEDVTTIGGVPHRWDRHTLTWQPFTSVKPRTKREKAIAAEAKHAGYQEGHVAGRTVGEEAGRRAERERHDTFVLKAMAAIAGKRDAEF